jgi:predicted anti-sigma-YlaC factor YlaD
MDCRDVVAQICTYLDPEAAEDLVRRLEAHVSACPDCRVYVDTVKKTILLYRSEAPLDCPDEVRARLHAALSFEYKKKA